MASKRNKFGKSRRVVRELKRIAREHEGVLLPEHVVDTARSTKSPLHSWFLWDDTEAAYQHRLWQARMLIRTSVRYIKVNGDMRPIRVFVSLTPDRKEDGGGYREMVTVLRNTDMRAVLLRDALEELRVFQQKYGHLKELAAVFKAVSAALAKAA